MNDDDGVRLSGATIEKLRISAAIVANVTHNVRSMNDALEE